jgi:hypothetical protein
MRKNLISTGFLSATAILLLCMVLLAPGKADAAAALIDPSTKIEGIPEAGSPAFVFNDGINSFGGDVQSWFDNYLVIQAVDGGNAGYNMTARNQGSFTYWETMGTSYGGSTGVFDLNATFDSDGQLTGGTVRITGAIAGIGIGDASTVLMEANLVDFDFDGDLMGFAIDNIVCDPGPDGGRIVGCQDDPAAQESIYFGLAADFPGIAELAGRNYRSTITSKTTVPIPASAWLLLSGLGLLSTVARRKQPKV